MKLSLRRSVLILAEQLALYSQLPHQRGLAGQLDFALFPWSQARRSQMPRPGVFTIQKNCGYGIAPANTISISAPVHIDPPQGGTAGTA
jgi:hypothetical protein